MRGSITNEALRSARRPGPFRPVWGHFRRRDADARAAAVARCIPAVPLRPTVPAGAAIRAGALRGATEPDLPRPPLEPGAGRSPDLPETGRPEPHLPPQDKQHGRSVATGAANGETSSDRESGDT